MTAESNNQENAQPTTSKHPRNYHRPLCALLLIIAITDVIGSVMFLVMSWMVQGFLQLHIVGVYSELVYAGAIDENIINERYAEQINKEMWYVPVGLFTENMIHDLWGLCKIVGVGMFVQGIVLIVISILILKHMNRVYNENGSKYQTHEQMTNQ